VAAEIDGARSDGGSARLLFLSGGAGQGRPARGRLRLQGEGAAAGGRARLQGLGLAAVGKGHDASLMCTEVRGAVALVVAAHGLRREPRPEGGVEQGADARMHEQAWAAALAAQGRRE
jgi:hypothetical protein